MKLNFNNEIIEIPGDFVTVASVAQMKDVPDQGAAIAVNDKLVKRCDWSDYKLKDGDHLTSISAAFGG